MTKDILRRVRFSPYRKGMGPTFALTMWDTHSCDNRGQTRIGYTLTMKPANGSGTVIFRGEDFCGSPMHADDSDATVACLMGFLTLRPGDTDADYFAAYDGLQLDFCANYAETLSCEVEARFSEEGVR
jgi:hypothetical protein